MRVLFITGAAPYPPNSGGTVRTYNLLSRLCSRHEITLITPAPVTQDVDLAAVFGHNMKKIVAIPDPHRGKAARALHTCKSLLSPLPYIVGAHTNPATNMAVLQALDSENYHVVHCDSISAVPALPPYTDVPRVFNAHNVEAVIWERYVREERKPHYLPILKSQSAKVAAFEARLPRLFDCCVTVSEEDRTEMRQRYGFRNVRIVKNGVDIDYYSPEPDPGTDTVAFIGSLDWRPNQDAVRWFIEAILPRIRVERPQVEVSVIGRRAPRWMAEMCVRAGVSLFSDVPDVRPHLAAASVVIVPLRIGGGSRLKILEAMAAGRSVVSTTIGAEGLEIVDGEHLLIADEPSDFARQVITLLKNPDQRQALSAAGRSRVETAYSWDRIAADLEDAWISVFAERTLG